MKKILKKKRKSLCKENISFLNYINSIPSNKRKKVINFIANKNEINAIIEVVLNFLNKNLHCKKTLIRSMKKNYRYFDKLIDRKRNLSSKKKILTSPKGGYILSTLLGLALPILKKIFL